MCAEKKSSFRFFILVLGCTTLTPRVLQHLHASVAITLGDLNRHEGKNEMLFDNNSNGLREIENASQSLVDR